jgi:hypothetical protein
MNQKEKTGFIGFPVDEETKLKFNALVFKYKSTKGEILRSLMEAVEKAELNLRVKTKSDLFSDAKLNKRKEMERDIIQQIKEGKIKIK